MKKTLYLTVIILLLFACSQQPPIYIFPRRSSENPQLVKDAYIQVHPIDKIELLDFEQSFNKKYNTEAAFITTFQQELSTLLNTNLLPGTESFILKLPKIKIGSLSESHNRFVPGAPNSHMASQEVSESTEYCVITLDYVVFDTTNKAVLSGSVYITTSKNTILSPHQSKLTYAIQSTQAMLAKYLRGNMPRENVRNFDNQKKQNTTVSQ